MLAKFANYYNFALQWLGTWGTINNLMIMLQLMYKVRRTF